MTRIPTAIAGLALVAVTVAACGSDDGSDAAAADPTSSATSASASDSPTDTPSPSGTASESASPSGDPVPSPVIDKAVKDAIKDHFPALIPAGVPAGWTVVSASYAAKGGGTWQIALTAPGGAAVTLVQSTASSADLVARLVPDGQPAGSVRLSGTGKWASYAGTGAAGLAKDLSGTGAVVVGPDQDTAVALAEQLLTAEDAGTGDGG
jgi:hypothetical protein